MFGESNIPVHLTRFRVAGRLLRAPVILCEFYDLGEEMCLLSNSINVLKTLQKSAIDDQNFLSARPKMNRMAGK